MSEALSSEELMRRHYRVRDRLIAAMTLLNQQVAGWQKRQLDGVDEHPPIFSLCLNGDMFTLCDVYETAVPEILHTTSVEKMADKLLNGAEQCGDRR